jgi:glycosyltransferase involved in cell wall biosynthesis
MDYEPNIDAATFFCTHIWPLVREKQPEAKLFIVGRNPSPEVKRLESKPAITVTGTVPDVSPYYKQAALTVVPLRSGSGTRLKIIESMAYGRVVVSTTIGAEGLEYQNGKSIFIYDEPEDMAEGIIRLMQNIKLREEIAISARKHAEQKYDSTVIADKLNAFYHHILKNKYHSSKSLAQTKAVNQPQVPRDTLE